MCLKIAIFLVLISVTNLFAINSYSQVAKVTLDMENRPLEEVMDEIEEQSEFYFIFNQKQVDVNRVVNFQGENKLINEVLQDLFEGTDINYAIFDRKILLTIDPLEIIPPVLESGNVLQQKVITGNVTDINGQPLIGVTVIVKGTTTGTLTDSDGKYTIQAPSEESILQFSSVGYTTQEVQVAGKSVINVTLAESILEMEEVVVTALGIKRSEKALSYAVSQVGGESFIKAREVNLGNALSGKIAGVNASKTATGPAGSSRVIIRGNGSLAGDNQPLYVVNGIPIDNSNLGSAGMWGGFDGGDGLSSIDPDDIENITVLKGGTSAALYGSRAANGVILITTKPGKAQKGIGVELSSTFTLETPLVFLDYQDQYGSGTRGAAPTTVAEAIASGTVSWGAKLDGSMVIQPDGISRPYIAQNNNIKNFYNVGNSFSNSIAFNGGNETAQFRFSASNVDDKSIIPNTSVNRKTFNLDVNANLIKKIEFKANVQYSIENAKNRPYVSDQPMNVNSAPALMATNIDIRTLEPIHVDENGFEPQWHIGDANNPYFIVNYVKNKDNRNRLIGSFNTRYNITDYLYVNGRFGIDFYNRKAENITPTGIKYWTPSMSASTRVTYETNIEGIVGFNKAFGEITVNAIAGGNQMHHVVDAVSLSSGRFNVPFQYFIRNGSGQSFGQTFLENAINSLFTSVDIGFRNYLYLTLTGREDWFSTLPIATNSLFYPSAGISFVFSDAWKNKPSWLNYGKVRASWAQVGGGAPDPYALNLVYVAQSSQHLGRPLMGISGSTIPNGSITPYTSTTTEFGIELRGLNRIGADITLYERRTTDDIVSASVSRATDYSSVLLNVGEVLNRGIELQLTGSPIESRTGLNWDISFNMAYNKNTVIKIAEGLNSLFLPQGDIRTKNGFIYHFEGLPYGQIAGYKIKTDENGNYVYNQASGLPEKSDFMALGNGTPPWTLGLSNSLNYKNFSLAVLFDGKFGGKLYSATNAYATQWGLHKRTVENNVRETGVTLQGVDLNGEPYNFNQTAQNYYQYVALNITDDFVYDASFIKLRQVVFDFSVPNSILAKTPFQSINLSLVGRNLLLIHKKVPNIDPESTYNNSNAQGLEMYGVPSTRSYGLNLMVRF